MRGLFIVCICILIISGCGSNIPEGAKCVKKHPFQFCQEWEYEKPIKSLEQKYWDIQKEINQKEYELYVLKRVAWMYKRDIEAKENNLIVEYKKEVISIV